MADEDDLEPRGDRAMTRRGNYAADGIEFADRRSYEAYMARNNARGSAGPLTTGADAAQAVAELFDAFGLRRNIRRVKRARRDLKAARLKIYDQLNVIDASGNLSRLQKEADDAQDRIDRNQTEALALGVDMALVRAGVSAVKVYDRVTGMPVPMGAINNGFVGSGGGLILAGGIGVMIGAALTDKEDEEDDDE